MAKFAFSAGGSGESREEDDEPTPDTATTGGGSDLGGTTGGASISAGRGSPINRNIDNTDIAQARGFETTSNDYQRTIDKAQKQASSDDGVSKSMAETLSVTNREVADAVVNNNVSGRDSGSTRDGGGKDNQDRQQDAPAGSGPPEITVNMPEAQQSGPQFVPFPTGGTDGGGGSMGLILAAVVGLAALAGGVALGGE